MKQFKRIKPPQYSLKARQATQKRRFFCHQAGKFCLALLLVCLLSGMLAVGVHAGNAPNIDTNQYKGISAVTDKANEVMNGPGGSWTKGDMANSVIALHQQLDSSLPQNNILSYPFRLLGWLLACGMGMIDDALSFVVLSVFKFLSGKLTGSSQLDKQLSDGLFQGSGFYAQGQKGGDLLQRFSGIGMALMAAALVLLGIQVVAKPQHIKDAARHIFEGVLISVSIPALVAAGLAVTVSLVSVAGIDQNTTMGSAIVAQNITDVFYYERAGMATDKSSGALITTKNGSQTKNRNDYLDSNNTKSPDNQNNPNLMQIYGIHPTEFVDSKTVCEDTDPKTLTQHVVFWETKLSSQRKGNAVVQYLDNRWDGAVAGNKISILSEEYYRYKVDWLNMYVALLVTGFVLLMAGIKWVRIMFELGIKQGLTQLLAVTDLRTMQRTKQALQSILGSLAALFGTTFMLTFYMAANTWISNITIPLPNGLPGILSSIFGILAKIILEIGLAWITIDGPDIFEKIFGIDVGVKDSMRTLYGLQSVGRATRGVHNGIFGSRVPNGQGGMVRVGGLFGQHGAASHLAQAGRGAVSFGGNVVSGAASAASALGGWGAGKRAARQALRQTSGNKAAGGQAAASPNLQANHLTAGQLNVTGTGNAQGVSPKNADGRQSAGQSQTQQRSSLQNAAVSPQRAFGGHGARTAATGQTASSVASILSGSPSGGNFSSAASRFANVAATPVMNPIVNAPLPTTKPAGANQSKPAAATRRSSSPSTVTRNTGPLQTTSAGRPATPAMPVNRNARPVQPRMSAPYASTTAAAGGNNSGSGSLPPLRGNGQTLSQHLGGQVQQAGGFIRQRTASLVKDNQGNLKKNAATRPYRAAKSAYDYAYNGAITRAQKKGK
ncbi:MULTISPECIES: pLS20_p028 family conjugation system transmembrane protein [Caproicibacterium]|uniref:DUF8208 domain-containing protein n=1 Tax=Caproicibacterium argilliputei TaxID=3030016 RepID=A0AA97DB31_9FIRM|nr:hypothetical protein [Caproicibacterium argilliputei]WOC32365.1 hypothetical protein PXC00_00425 [Caproicibacterium argilliputei]